MIRPWREGKTLSLVDFETEVLWIHIVGLPRICYTVGVGIKSVANFLNCCEIQIHEKLDARGKFFNLRVSVDLSRPL